MQNYHNAIALQRSQERTPDEVNAWMMKRQDVWQRIPVEELEFPSITGATFPGALSPDQVNMLYETVDHSSPAFGPLSFLARFDTIIVRHKGNFPMPGWHAWMVQSRFLEYCEWKFRAHPAYSKWHQAVFGRPGVSYGETQEVNQKKALLPEQMEEQTRPRKRVMVKRHPLSQSMCIEPDTMCVEDVVVNHSIPSISVSDSMDLF